MKQQKINKAQTKKNIPLIKEFNKLADVFINILQQRIQRKKERLANIKVMVSGISLPMPKSNINIQTIDINYTKVKKKGSFATNQTMNWEHQYRNRKKGIIL